MLGVVHAFYQAAHAANTYHPRVYLSRSNFDYKSPLSLQHTFRRQLPFRFGFTPNLCQVAIKGALPR